MMLLFHSEISRDCEQLKATKVSKTLSILTGLICYATVFVNCDPIAHIGDCQIVGQKVRYSNMEANQFLGVPYAKPPLGDLRFMKTKPICKYPKLVETFRQPPACPQYTKNPYPWYISSGEKSEDCLYLNIWTPREATPQNTKAVFYWIHGGGNRYGSIRDPLYTGTALAAMGDIIVVTVNYRLGPFGFLSSGTDDAPGNAGLWDILEGLRWVNKNIAAFGGDTSRITIAGESAGSVAVSMLSSSPLSQDLFTRQIMESGSPLARGFDQGAQLNPILAQNLSVLVGCADEGYTIQDHPSEVVQCLKDVDAETLSRMDSLILPHSTADFVPQYDDDFVPTDTQKSSGDGEFCSELLIGANRDEGSPFLTSSDPDLFGFFGQKGPQMNKTSGKDFIRNFQPPFPDPEALVKYYLPDSVPENDYETVGIQVYTFITDSLLICPTVYYAEKYSEKGNDVYFYYYVHRASTTPWAPWLGVAHFSEIQFVFGQPLLNPQKYRPEEVDLSLNVIQMWSNFVKYGKPNLNWPLYSKDNPVLRKIGSTSDRKFNSFEPRRRSCDFLRPNFEL